MRPDCMVELLNTPSFIYNSPVPLTQKQIKGKSPLHFLIFNTKLLINILKINGVSIAMIQSLLQQLSKDLFDYQVAKKRKGKNNFFFFYLVGWQKKRKKYFFI